MNYAKCSESAKHLNSKQHQKTPLSNSGLVQALVRIRRWLTRIDTLTICNNKIQIAESYWTWVTELYWTLCKAGCNLATVAMDHSFKNLKKPWRNSGHGPMPAIVRLAEICHKSVKIFWSFSCLHVSSCAFMCLMSSHVSNFALSKGYERRNVGTSGWASVGPSHAGFRYSKGPFSSFLRPTELIRWSSK